MKNLTLSLLLLLVSYCLLAQSYYVSGVVTNQQKETIPGVSVTIKGTANGTSTDFNGYFKVKLPEGTRVLIFSGVGFESQELQVDRSFRSGDIKIQLQEDTQVLGEVVVETKKLETQQIKEAGFSVEVVELKNLSGQSIDINSVLDHTPGVRVKRSGGMGSDFVYSLDGMSGNSIRFLVDGIPIDFFGSVYNINNFPISLINRVEVYKGVVPVYLAADALGGAINIITSNEPKDFLEASYSFGSFNTHRAAIQGQWRHKQSGFTTRLATFYNYSDNDYKVWGKTVTYYDESTGYRTVEFTKDNPATRFNDDYQAYCVKADIGFTNKPWADQLFLGMLASDVNRGVQHGQTMAYVFGDMRYEERFYMPSFTYFKKDLIADGFDLKLFSSYAMTRGVSIDTSTSNYNWRGDVVSIDLDGGERRNQRSLFTLNDKALINSVNASYALNQHFDLVLNYLYKGINRTGTDDYQPWHTIPFTEPQTLTTTFTGLSLNSSFLNDRLKTDLFIKHYGYNASITEVNESGEDTDQRVLEVNNKQNHLGEGVAGSFKLSPKVMLKLSVERAIRLPDTREALGNGVNILNSPHIKPEKSFNINMGASLGHYWMGSNHSVKVNLNGFYRDTKDLIFPTPSGGRGEITYENINKVLGKGLETEIIYDYKSRLEVNLNATYLDMRNNEVENKYGVKNIFYWDRLRNAPYLMSNITLTHKTDHFIQENSRSFAYARAGYVHEYYLGWPSAGSADSKSIIPTQFVVDVGGSYIFPNQLFSMGLDITNILNTQVYDNFLLQKPGRAFALKLSYRISEE